MLLLEIDRRWEPEDFIEVLKSIESIYYKTIRTPIPSFSSYWLPLSFEENLDFTNDWLLAQARIIIDSHSRLRIGRIEYASPGGIDFVGLGEACKAIEGILDRLIKFFTERHLRRERDRQAEIETGLKQVELEKQEESLRTIKLENARSILRLRADYPDVDDYLVLSLITRDQDKLIPRIVERKLIGVRMTEGEPPATDKAA